MECNCQVTRDQCSRNKDTTNSKKKREISAGLKWKRSSKSGELYLTEMKQNMP